MTNPTVQHRHYKAIADALATAREYELDVLGSPNMQQHERVERALDRLEQRFVILFRGDNCGFSEDRFRKAARRDPKMHGKDRVAA